MIATTKPLYRSSKPALRDIDWESGPDRKLTHNTYRGTAWIDNTWIPVVRFHATIILESHGNGIYVLNSGGWQTSTTKQRLNALLWNLGIQVWQRDFQWYICDSQGERLFEDNIRVIAKGWEGCY